MKRIWLLAILGLVAVPASAPAQQTVTAVQGAGTPNTVPWTVRGTTLGSLTRLGQIVSTNASSKDNTNTASTFTITKGSRILIQCDVATYVNFLTATGTATSTNLKVQADAAPDFKLATSVNTIATLGVASTSTCQVFSIDA